MTKGLELSRVGLLLHNLHFKKIINIGYVFTDQLYLMHDRFLGKTVETLDAIDYNRNRRRSEPTAHSRPESRRLHPVGALAHPTGKKLQQVQRAFIYNDKEEAPR